MTMTLTITITITITTTAEESKWMCWIPECVKWSSLISQQKTRANNCPLSVLQKGAPKQKQKKKERKKEKKHWTGCCTYLSAYIRLHICVCLFVLVTVLLLDGKFSPQWNSVDCTAGSCAVLPLDTNVEGTWACHALCRAWLCTPPSHNRPAQEKNPLKTRNNKVSNMILNRIIPSIETTFVLRNWISLFGSSMTKPSGGDRESLGNWSWILRELIVNSPGNDRESPQKLIVNPPGTDRESLGNWSGIPRELIVNPLELIVNPLELIVNPPGTDRESLGNWSWIPREMTSWTKAVADQHIYVHSI